MLEIVRYIGKVLIFVFFIMFARYVSLKKRQIDIKNSSIKEKKLLEKKTYTLEYGIAQKIVSVICLFGWSLFWINEIGNNFLGVGFGIGSDIFTFTMASIFEILSLYIFSFVCIWRVKVSDNEVEYRNYFGRKKHYKLDDIFVVSKRDGEVEVYQNYKKIFTVGLFVKNKQVFLMHIMENSNKSLKNT